MNKTSRLLIHLFLLIGLFLWINSSKAQNFLELMDNDSNETNAERLTFMVDFMKPLDFERVADIGSGNMEFILKIANEFPDKSITIEDIDSNMCHWANMISKINKFELRNIDTTMLSIHIGEVKSTTLPDHQFDLVIMSGLIHEIDFKDAFFMDIKRILKDDGSLIISDAFYEFPPGPHHGCANRYLTNSEFEEIIKYQQLIVHKDWRRIGIQTKNQGTYISRIIQCTFH
jgi:ubiquinone/menaquinone biosynthesis C-methylase UbiE